MSKLRVGLIGLGQIGRDRHLPFYENNKHVEIVGICDLDRNKLQNVKYPTYLDYRQLLTQDLDLVDICTPPFDHVQLSVECLDAGCHILVEKPFTFTVSGCDHVLEHAESLRKQVCVMHSSLFFPVMLHLRKVFHKIGNICHIRIGYNVSIREHVMCNNWIMKMPYQMLDEQIPHVAYLINEFMYVSHVDVMKNRIGITDLPYNHYTILLNGVGTIATIDILYGDDWAFNIELIGDRGKLYIDLLHQLYRFEPLSETISPSSVVKRVVSNVLSPFTYISHLMFKPYGHEYVIHRFIDAICGRGDSPVSHRDIRETVHITELINKCMG